MPLAGLQKLKAVHLNSLPIKISAATLETLLEAWETLEEITLTTQTQHSERRFHVNDLTVLAKHGRCLRHVQVSIQNPLSAVNSINGGQASVVSHTVSFISVGCPSYTPESLAASKALCNYIFPDAAVQFA